MGRGHWHTEVRRRQQDGCARGLGRSAHLGGISKLVITDSPGQEIDHIQYGFSVIPTPHDGVPEPAAWALMLTGFLGMGAMLRRRRAASPDPAAPRTLQAV